MKNLFCVKLDRYQWHGFPLCCIIHITNTNGEYNGGSYFVPFKE